LRRAALASVRWLDVPRLPALRQEAARLPCVPVREHGPERVELPESLPV
jgi:hypothetical protein